MMRASGIVVMLLSGVLVVVATQSLWRTNEMTETLRLLSAGRGQPFDPRNWAFHWRLSSFALLAVAITALIAGAGLTRRRYWGLVLWCVLVTLLLFGQIAMNIPGLATYSFEEAETLEIAATGVVCAASWTAAWRASRVHDVNRAA